MSYATKIACYEAAVGTILISIEPIARNYDTYEAAIGTIYITIEPFEVKESGAIKGKVVTDKIDDSFDLFYTRYDNYAIVWTKKNYEKV